MPAGAPFLYAGGMQPSTARKPGRDVAPSSAPPAVPKMEGASTPVNGPKFDVLGAIQALLQGQAQSDQMQQSSDREAQGGIHRDMGGRPIDRTAPAPGTFGSPITFPSAAERYSQMAGYPNISAPPRNDFSNPYFAGALPEAAPSVPPPSAPGVGSYVAGAMPGTMDLVGPTDPLSGGGNMLQQGIVPGSATTAPLGPGMQPSPAGNAFPPQRPPVPGRPAPFQAPRGFR